MAGCHISHAAIISAAATTTLTPASNRDLRVIHAPLEVVMQLPVKVSTARENVLKRR
jgi:hypothetical protein